MPTFKMGARVRVRIENHVQDGLTGKIDGIWPGGDQLGDGYSYFVRLDVPPLTPEQIDAGAERPPETADLESHEIEAA